MAKAVSKPKKSGLTPKMQQLLEEARRNAKITPGNGQKISLEPIGILESEGPTIAEIISEGRR